ncbi:fumarylacetoacetate hydrolase family protein [Brevibacterium aurantiacum]|uniref:2-oxo-hepta-3-ene-1,7-dioic acid hydratase n=1 Tax=Brevibacterium aurantiacum TaxID=273384 RepID=A0A1D7W0L6_BREAU|nr:fumarylacetoacetate hydrolase family protein [Brevibacterium aurantiacum]AOP52522.1 2-oxo-hepta-3-ene-1,7-dioic acid hydratase [Brevibacterium aurantiacum]MDN5661726.1 2-oxo-hepta-3-ene-1,7-dioate hydratase [Brevibacterium aurantiacum]RCT00341.1 2-oxo-hepta-3-ene-1,7-dioate hydratase [Brevibacterium aurantiacum]
MLDETTIAAIADDLANAEKNRSKIGLLTAKYPDMTVEDSYAVQNEWRRRGEASGRRLIGHKIGLTSKPMQQATGISEPDYGAIFADQVYDTGSVIDHSQYSGVRVEVELAFVLKDELRGPDISLIDVLRATEYVVPALEVLSSRIEMEGRTIVDTISDNAALGGMVLGGNPVVVDAVDLRRVGALLYRNESVEDSGLAAAVLDHPARGIVWLANKLAEHGDVLQAGETVLAGSFTRPMWVSPGDTVHADYGDLGVITCRFE